MSVSLVKSPAYVRPTLCTWIRANHDGTEERCILPYDHAERCAFDGTPAPIVDRSSWDGEYLSDSAERVTIGDRVEVFGECTITVERIDMRGDGCVWLKGAGPRWHRLGRFERVRFVPSPGAPDHCHGVTIGYVDVV